MDKTFESILKQHDSYTEDLERDLLRHFEKHRHNIARARLSELRKKVERIPTRKIDMPVSHMHSDYVEGKDFVSKDIVLNLIDNMEP